MSVGHTLVPAAAVVTVAPLPRGAASSAGARRRRTGAVISGSVPLVRLPEGPGCTGTAVAVPDVDQARVDLPVRIRGLGDPGAGPRGVEELGNAIGGAGGVLRAGIPAALALPELIQARGLPGVPAELAERVGLVGLHAGRRPRR